MAEDLEANFDSRDLWARHASTKAIIVEYAKPWSGNKDKLLKHFAEIDTYLGNLRQSAEHIELKKLRDGFAAHTDKGVHPVALVLQP